MSSYKFHLRNFDPLVAFSLGLILGASIVALIFFYGLALPDQYESASLKFKNPVTKNLGVVKGSVSPGGSAAIGGSEPTVGVNGRTPGTSIGGPEPTRGL